jgi:hypothetical protein
MKITVCGSHGTLVFPTKDLHQEFEERFHNLYMETYAKIRGEYGVWAGNQNKFVPTREDLNEWDGTYMEDQYEKYLKRE